MTKRQHHLTAFGVGFIFGAMLAPLAAYELLKKMGI